MTTLDPIEPTAAVLSFGPRNLDFLEQMVQIMAEAYCVTTTLEWEDGRVF